MADGAEPRIMKRQATLSARAGCAFQTQTCSYSAGVKRPEPQLRTGGDPSFYSCFLFRRIYPGAIVEPTPQQPTRSPRCQVARCWPPDASRMSGSTTQTVAASADQAPRPATAAAQKFPSGKRLYFKRRKDPHAGGRQNRSPRGDTMCVSCMATWTTCDTIWIICQQAM